MSADDLCAITRAVVDENARRSRTGRRALFLVFDQIYGAGSFGDGRLCVAGTMARLGSVPSVGGAAAFPRPTDPALSVVGGLPAAGGRRTYQVWYRNAAAFCTSSTFNLTNGLIVRWSP